MGTDTLAEKIVDGSVNSFVRRVSAFDHDFGIGTAGCIPFGTIAKYDVSIGCGVNEVVMMRSGTESDQELRCRCKIY